LAMSTTTVDLDEVAGFINHPTLKARCKEGEIGQILLLQPRKESGNLLPCPLLVGNLLLSTKEGYDDVRVEQTKFFLKILQSQMSTLHCPLILGGSLSSTPASGVYEIITTGKVPLLYGPPPAPGKAKVEILSRASVKVKVF